MTSGLLSWWAWLLILFGIIIVALLQQIVGQSGEERVSVLDFLKEAERRGVNFKGKSHAILDLCRELQQAASEGIVPFWGKARFPTDVFLEIPKEHWYESRIYWEAAFEFGPPAGEIKGFTNENFFINTHNKIYPDRRAHLDLHMNRAQALRWLRRYVHGRKP